MIKICGSSLRQSVLHESLQDAKKILTENIPSTMLAIGLFLGGFLGCLQPLHFNIVKSFFPLAFLTKITDLQTTSKITEAFSRYSHKLWRENAIASIIFPYIF